MLETKKNMFMFASLPVYTLFVPSSLSRKFQKLLETKNDFIFRYEVLKSGKLRAGQVFDNLRRSKDSLVRIVLQG